MDTAITGDGANEDKPWMVLVHGMSQDHRIFSAQVEAFRGSHRILLVDLPGHGGAATAGGPYGHAEFAAHVAREMDTHGIRGARFWGTHTGATVGLVLAATRPELMSALLLEGPVVPGRNPPIVAHLIARARQRLAEDGLEAALGDWWANSCWFDYMRTHPETARADAHRAIVLEFGGAPWRDTGTPAMLDGFPARLSGISCPVMIYNGAADHTDFLAAAGEIASCIGTARRSRIAHAGGFPAWENPDTVNAEVATFLAAHC